MTEPQTPYVEAERPPYLLAGLVTLGALVLYVATLAPTTQFWDTSEYIAAAQVLGIPHPPGNPLFVLIAHTWGLLPLAAGYAMRINLLAGVTSAIAAGCWFLVSERWMRAWVPARLPRRLAAVTGVLVGPAVVVLLFPPLKDQRPADEAERRVEWSQWFVFCSVYALIVASGLENAGPLKLAAVLFLGALAYAFVQARNWDFAVAVLLVAIVGVSVYLFLPIRAAHFPPINEGEPTTQQALWDVLTRQQYGKPPVWERQATLWAQLGMWFQYFSWQWGRDFPGSVQAGLAVVFGALGVLGAVRHWLADRRRAIAMTALVVTFTLFLIFYLNFKYGYSWQSAKHLSREGRERDYFFIASFALWGVWVGMGLATLMEWISECMELR